MSTAGTKPFGIKSLHDFFVFYIDLYRDAWNADAVYSDENSVRPSVHQTETHEL